MSELWAFKDPANVPEQNPGWQNLITGCRLPIFNSPGCSGSQGSPRITLVAMFESIWNINTSVEIIDRSLWSITQDKDILVLWDVIPYAWMAWWCLGASKSLRRCPGVMDPARGCSANAQALLWWLLQPWLIPFCFSWIVEISLLPYQLDSLSKHFREFLGPTDLSKLFT